MIHFRAVRRLSGFFCGLVLFLLFSCTPVQASSRLTSLFLRAWQPELGWEENTPLQQLSPAETTLLRVASQARAGNFAAANQELRSLTSDTTNNSASTRLLTLLFTWQASDRAYALLSGDENAGGETSIALIEITTVQQRLMQQLLALEPQILPAEKKDAMFAMRFNAVLGSHRRLTALNRAQSIWRHVNPVPLETENTEDQQFAAAYQNQRTLLISEMEPVFTEAAREGIIDEGRAFIARQWMRATWSIGDEDAPAAREYYRLALERAQADHLERATAETMLRLGDLEAAPWGSVEAFGWYLSSEYFVRLWLGSGATPIFVQGPSPDAIVAAESWYMRAAEVLKRHPVPGGVYQLLMRRAHLARMRGDFTGALDGFRQAATQARIDRQSGQVLAATPGAIADASYALVSGADGLLRASMRDLRTEENMGAMLSIGEIALSWGFRLARIYPGSPGVQSAITLIRPAATTMLESGLGASTVSHWLTLVELYNQLGQTEFALDAMRTANRVQDTIPARQAAAVEAAHTAGVTMPPGGVEPFEFIRLKNRFDISLNLLYTLQSKMEEEGPELWQKERNQLETEVVPLANQLNLQMMVRPYLDAKRRYDQTADFRRAETCAQVLQYYPAARAVWAEGGMVSLALSADAIAARCDPSLLPTARTELRRFEPIHRALEMVRAALPPGGGAPDLAGMSSFQVAQSSMARYLDLAVALEDYDLIAEWINQIESAIVVEPRLQPLLPNMQVYRAIVLLGRGQPSAARAICLDLIRSPAFVPLGPMFRTQVFDLLIECDAHLSVDSQTGQNAEEALWARENLRYEQSQIQILRTGLNSSDLESAELASLLRDRALGVNLSPEYEARLRDLQEKTRFSTAFMTPPPSIAEVQSEIKALPPRTTLLVYHLNARGLVLWTATRDQPLRLIRLTASVDETQRSAAQLRKALYNNMTERHWQPSAQNLYQALIVPAGPLPVNNTLVISLPQALAPFPFEMLGPDARRILLRDHPVLYANRLTKSSLPETGNQTVIPATRVVIVSPDSDSIPEARLEAEEIAGEVKERLEVHSLLGVNATLSNLESELPEAKWLHIATHGTLDSANPYRSYLLLQDRRLEAWRLFQKAPRAELIVLSACDTGRASTSGGIAAGLSGDSSSLASFAEATGTRWIVASQWKADDQITRRLMVQLYKELFAGMSNTQGIVPAPALQKAKMSVWKEGRQPPWYYAGFLLTVRDLSVLH